VFVVDTNPTSWDLDLGELISPWIHAAAIVDPLTAAEAPSRRPHPPLPGGMTQLPPVHHYAHR